MNLVAGDADFRRIKAAINEILFDGRFRKAT